jgi:phenylacetate-CoA ligase
MRWLDTAGSWNWFKQLWGVIFRAAQVVPGERLMFPFSFGPFVGFWAAFEGAVALGNLCLPAGGLSTGSRLKLLVENDVDVVCCTPTYALHMAETAAAQGIDLPSLGVRSIIVAGEPGGSIPTTRARIESAWGATLIDHAGATEVGPWGYADSQRRGLHVNEASFVATFIFLFPVADSTQHQLTQRHCRMFWIVL